MGEARFTVGAVREVLRAAPYTARIAYLPHAGAYLPPQLSVSEPLPGPVRACLHAARCWLLRCRLAGGVMSAK
jgi:hypothetical protein